MRGFVLALSASVVVGVVCAQADWSSASGGSAASACRAPKLVGLTVSVARQRAHRAGCALEAKGSTIQQAAIQTIQRQDMSGHTVTVWVNPFCRSMADSGPPSGSEGARPGPEELITGFYLAGGPLRRFSSAHCKHQAATPGAGTVTVTNPATGSIVATRTVARGHLAVIPLAASSYTVAGAFADATINGQHPTRSLNITIPKHHTLRENMILPIK